MSAVDTVPDDTHQTTQARRRWMRLMGIAGGLAAVLLVYNGVAFNLALHGEDHKPRDPATGLLVGAEPRDLGTEDSPCAALFIHGFGGAGTDFAGLPERLAESGWASTCKAALPSLSAWIPTNWPRPLTPKPPSLTPSKFCASALTSSASPSL